MLHNFQTVYVINSTTKEGFPKTILESMRDKMPAIISDAKGKPKIIVQNGTKSNIFKCGDQNSLYELKILFLTKNELEIKEIIDFNYKQVINNYSCITIAKQNMDIYQT